MRYMAPLYSSLNRDGSLLLTLEYKGEFKFKGCWGYGPNPRDRRPMCVLL
jgi:hypothetical protein